MKFIVRYENNIFHLYGIYYDTEKEESVQIVQINNNYDIILKNDKKKIIYAPTYLKFLK